MKKMKKLLCIACAAIALSSISVALNNLSTATASANETPVLTNVFTMDEGASVRKVSPGGIRFTTLVSNDIKSDDKTFGTLIIPTEKLGEATLNFEAAETLSVLDIPATTWKVQGNDTTLWEYTGVIVGANNADLNEALWDKELTAVGYYYTGDDKSTAVYTTEQIAPQKRSLAQTASLALQAGETGATLTKIVDKIVEKNKDSLDLSLAFSANDTVAYTADSYAPNDSFTLYLQGNEGLAAKWSSSDDTVATVDKNGKVSVLANGEATITASIGSHSVAFTLTADDRLPVCGQPYTLEANGYVATAIGDARLNASKTEAPMVFSFEKALGANQYYLSYTESGTVKYVGHASSTSLNAQKTVWNVNLDKNAIYSTADTSRALALNSSYFRAYTPSATYIAAWFSAYDAEAAEQMNAVANAKETLTLDTETVTEAKTIALTTAIESVSIAWEVVSGAEVATIDNGNLVITIPEENATVVVKATLTLGKAADSKEFEIAVQGAKADIPVGYENIADFDTLGNANTSYTTRTTTDGWVAENSAINTTTISGATSLVLNGKTTAVGTLTSPIFNNGITKLSLKYNYPNSETSGVDFTISIKNATGVVLASVNVVAAKPTAAVEYIWELETTIEGNIVIVIVNNSPSKSTSNKDRLAIGNLRWWSIGDKAEVVVPEVTDADKVAAEKAALSFKDQTLNFTVGDNEAKTIPLPVTPSKYTDVSIAWDVVGDVTGVEVVINGATMSVTLTDATESFSFKVKATLSLNDASVESNEYTITVNVTAQSGGDDGEDTPALSNAELSFSSTANRLSQSSTKQVWQQNGITFTNNKASSSTDVANYSKPVRLYAGSEIIIEGAGMTKIVFNCNTTGYATALKNSIGTVSGATVSVSSKVVTVTFASAVDSFTVAKLTAQVRIDSIVVNG